MLLCRGLEDRKLAVVWLWERNLMVCLLLFGCEEGEWRFLYSLPVPELGWGGGGLATLVVRTGGEMYSTVVWKVCFLVWSRELGWILMIVRFLLAREGNEWFTTLWFAPCWLYSEKDGGWFIIAFWFWDKNEWFATVCYSPAWPGEESLLLSGYRRIVESLLLSGYTVE